jgi:hypothetical protein
MSVNNFSEIIVLHIDLQLFSYMFKVLFSTSLNWLSICAIIISSFVVVVVDDEDVDITLSVFIVFKLVVFILLHVTELFISFVLLFVFVLLLI